MAKAQTVKRIDEQDVMRRWSAGEISATEASLALGREDRDHYFLIEKLKEYGLPYPDPLADLPDHAERVRKAAQLFRTAGKAG